MYKLCLSLLFIAHCSLGFSSEPPLDTVEYVDINRYLGKWYEIARFDHRFQRGCTATSATYTMREDGDIKVLNKCNLNSPTGKLKEAEGRAWINDTVSNAKLKVQFFLRGVRLPLFAGDYWILELDENYNFALVGDKSRKYLWILSRTKTLSNSTLDMLKKSAQDKGFDITKLEITKHEK